MTEQKTKNNKTERKRKMKSDEDRLTKAEYTELSMC